MAFQRGNSAKVFCLKDRCFEKSTKTRGDVSLRNFSWLHGHALRARLLFAVLMLVLAPGCAVVEQPAATEEAQASSMLALPLDEDWHRVSSPAFAPARVWTLEGAAIDQLMLYSLKEGESLGG